MAMKVKSKTVDLGKAQEEFEASQREWQAAERALARALEDRDKKKARAVAADEALRGATRTVLG